MEAEQEEEPKEMEKMKMKEKKKKKKRRGRGEKAPRRRGKEGNSADAYGLDAMGCWRWEAGGEGGCCEYIRTFVHTYNNSWHET